MYWAPPSPYACILLVPLKNVTLIQACTVQATLMQACTQFSFPIVKLWSLQKVCIHAYHQIHMEPDGIPKKAITTLFGLFELVWLLLRHSSGLKTRFVRALLLLCVALHLSNGTKTTHTWYSNASVTTELSWSTCNASFEWQTLNCFGHRVSADGIWLRLSNTPKRSFPF